MGCCVSSSGVTINLHQNNSVYFTDEILSGTIVWNNENRTIRTREIYIMLIGEIGYTTERMVYDGREGTTTVVVSHRAKFYSSKISLARSESKKESVVFSQGQYSWPFEFSVTHYLPPTINLPKQYPHVKYYLKVVIERPRYTKNIKKLRYLTIYPRISLSENPQWLQTTLFKKKNRKEILLKGIINKTCFVPGETIELTIEIDNPRDVRIKHINLLILQWILIGLQSKEKYVLITILPTIENTNRRQIKETFSITILDLSLPPSCKFHGGIIKPAFVTNEYLIRLAVTVEGIFTNFDIDIPIIIATESRSHLYQPSSSVLESDDTTIISRF